MSVILFLQLVAKGDGEGSGPSNFTLRENELCYLVGEISLVDNSSRRWYTGF